MNKRLTSSLVAIVAVVALGAFAVSVATASPATRTVHRTMKIVGHEEGIKGSDGLKHDTTFGANFTVKVGEKVVVTVYNYDEGPHTITAAGLKLNVSVPGAKDEEKGIPSKTVFTFTPTKAGTFRWHCALPCDKGQGYWAMSSGPSGKPDRDRFMAGYITVAA